MSVEQLGHFGLPWTTESFWNNPWAHFASLEKAEVLIAQYKQDQLVNTIIRQAWDRFAASTRMGSSRYVRTVDRSARHRLQQITDTPSSSRSLWNAVKTFDRNEYLARWASQYPDEIKRNPMLEDILRAYQERSERTSMA